MIYNTTCYDPIVDNFSESTYVSSRTTSIIYFLQQIFIILQINKLITYDTINKC